MNNSTKMDTTMKVLLVLAIITALLISSLLLYKVFVYDKKENTKDNDIINKDNNKPTKRTRANSQGFCQSVSIRFGAGICEPIPLVSKAVL